MANPVVATVTSPIAGEVTFTKTGGGLAPAGYNALGFGVVISAPQASAENPLNISFAVDATGLPAGTPPSAVVVFRNGAPVAPCGNGASVDPCVSSQTVQNGVLTITVRSSHASTWTFATAKVARIAGADRIATAIAASTAQYAASAASAVVLARSDAFPDALAGTPLAVAKKAPLLLTGSAALDPSVRKEIGRVLPAGGTVYMLGGIAALSPAIADRLATDGYHVVRYGGSDRFATATLIADVGLGNPSTVFEASGLNFADALAAGAAAAQQHGAVLLTQGSSQASTTGTYLAKHPGKRYAVGGPAASADTKATPLVGANRYETAVAVAKKFFSTISAPTGLASGQNFPDALSGGAAIGAEGGPLLLVPASGDVPTSVSGWLSSRPNPKRAVVYGGRGAVGDDIVAAVSQALG